MTIEQEIAELMREDWSAREWRPHQSFLPDLESTLDLGLIEWWCRDRGVWIHYEPEYGTSPYSVTYCGGWFRVAETFKEALLAAVRLAAKEE